MTEPSVREHVVTELLAGVRRAEDALADAVRREVAALAETYEPTAAEWLAANARLRTGPLAGRDALVRLDFADPDAPDAPDEPVTTSGGSAFDLTYRQLHGLAQAYRAISRWWLPADRRPLGVLLKTVPPEVAHETVGFLVWAGAVDPPDGGGEVAILRPPEPEA